MTATMEPENSGSRVKRIVDTLQKSKDPPTLQKGLGDLNQEISKRPSGDESLHVFLQSSPDCAVLQAIWDKQLSTQTHAVTINLMQLMAAILSCDCSSLPKGQADFAKEKQDDLAATILSRRLKALYFHLTSDAAPRAAAALQLLADVAASGPAMAQKTATMFDWTLSSLPKICRPPKSRMAGGEAGAGRSIHTREAFVEFGLALLAQAEELQLQSLLQLRPLMAGLLHFTASDLPSTAYRVLIALHRFVLNRPKGSSTLVPALKGRIFTDAAISQLIDISARDLEDTNSSGQRLVQLAARILAQLCSDPSLGVCPTRQTDQAEGLLLITGASGNANNAGRHRRRFLKLLQSLRLEVPVHVDILHMALTSFPGAAAAFLNSLTYSVEPECTARWFSAVTATKLAIRSAALGPLTPQDAPEADKDSIGARGRAQPHSRPVLKQLVGRIVPQSMSKISLSRGVQHRSPLVRQVTLSLLCEQLKAAEDVLSALEAAGAQDPRGPSAWEALATRLRGMLRLRLPDLQAFVSLYSGLQRKAPGAANKGEEDSDAMDLDAADNKLNVFGRLSMSVMALQALRHIKVVIPEAVSAANFDVARLLPEDLGAIHPAAHLGMLRCVGAGALTSLPALGTQPLQALLSLAASSPHPELVEAAADVMGKLLHDSGACAGRHGSHVLWLWSLERGDGAGAPSFLAQAIAQASRRPQEPFEWAQEHLQSAGLGTKSCPSLLTVVAIRQSFKVVGSQKIATQERLGVAAYVARVVGCLLQVEGSAEGLAVLVAAAFAEATSPLPNEARPLKSLLVLCHRLCGPGATVQDESNGRSKGEDADKDRPKKKSKRKAAQEEVSSSSLEPSAAAALWSSALNKAGLESWQSGEELLGELLSWGGSELMSQLQVMGATTFPGKAEMRLDGTPLLLLLPAAFLLRSKEPRVQQDESSSLRSLLLGSSSRLPAEAKLLAVRALLFWAGRSESLATLDELLGVAASVLEDALSHVATWSGHCAAAAAVLKHPFVEASYLGTADGAAREERQGCVDRRVTGMLVAFLASPPGPLLAEGWSKQNPAVAAAARKALEKARAEAEEHLGGRGSGASGLEAALRAVPYLPAPWINECADVSFTLLQSLEKKKDGRGEAAAVVGAKLAGALLRCGNASFELTTRLGDAVVRALTAVSGAPEDAAPSPIAMAAIPSVCCLPVHILVPCSVLRADRAVAVTLGAIGAHEKAGDLLEQLVAAVPGARTAFASGFRGALGLGAEEHTGAGKLPASGRSALALMLPAVAALLETCLPPGAIQCPSSAGGTTVGEKGQTFLAPGEPLWRPVVSAALPLLLGFLGDEWQPAMAESVSTSSSSSFGPGAHRMSAKAQSAARKFSARVTAMCLALSRDEDKEEHLSERICSDERLKEGDLAACEGAACLGAVLRCRSMSSSSDDINAKLLCKVATKVVLAVAAAVSAAPKGEETSSEGGAWKQAELWGGEQVDSWLGDALAALPLKKRTTSGFRKVARAASQLTKAVLKHRHADAGSLRMSRRLMAALLPQDDDAPAELAGDSDAAAVSDVAVELLEEISEHPGIRESLLGNAEQRSHGGGSGDLPSEASALLPPLSSLLGALALAVEAAPAESDMAEIAQQKELRKEVAELVETLVDVAGQFRGGSAAGQLDKALHQLRPLLRAAYGGTLASDDVSLLRAIRTLDGLPSAAEAGSRALWGLASNQAHHRGEEAAAGGEGDDDAGEDVQQRMLLSCLQSAPPDPRRCALTVLYFPENRGPGGLDDGDESHEAVDALTLRDGGAREAECRAAAYDPAALVGLTVATLRSGICGHADLRLLAQLGMLSVCVRALSSNVESMRTLALEAVKLYQAALDPAAFRESSDINQLLSELLQLLSPPRGSGQQPDPSKDLKKDDSSSDSDGSDVSSSSSDSSEDDSSDSDSDSSSSSDASGSSMSSAAAEGVSSDGAAPGRVPAHVTVLCAEAVVVLLSPKHSMHRTIQKALGRGSLLDANDLPLFNRLMFSTSKDTRSDLDWILRCLSISITSDAEAQVFRRRFVAELVTAYAGSATASAATTTLCLCVVSSIASVPSSARDFALHSGGLQWLSMFVTSHLDGASSQSLAWALTAIRTMAKVITGLCASSPVHPAAAMDLFSAVRSVLSGLIRATPSLRPEDAPMPRDLLSIWEEALGLMAALLHKESERLAGSAPSSGPSNSYITAAELAKVAEAAEAEPELYSSALRLLLTWQPELSVDSAQKPDLVLCLALWASRAGSRGLHDDLPHPAPSSGTIKTSSTFQWLSRLSASGWLTPAALPSESSLAVARSVLEAQLGLPWAQRVQCLKPSLRVAVRAIQRAAATSGELKGDSSAGSDCNTWYNTATDILPQLLKRVSFPPTTSSVDVISSGGEAFAAEMALGAAARLVLLPPVAADKDERNLRTKAPAAEADCVKAVRKELVAAVKAAASE